MKYLFAVEVNGFTDFVKMPGFRWFVEEEVKERLLFTFHFSRDMDYYYLNVVVGFLFILRLILLAFKKL